MTERQATIWQKRLGPVLAPVGWTYSQIMAARSHAYRRGFFSRWRAPKPVISAGNISWGGTGKTPICSFILSWAEEKSLRPALLTRGYGGRTGALPLLVDPTCPAGECGDEPLVLAREHPDSLVVVDPVRSRAGQWALARHEPDFFVLDDGFQHLAMVRDLDLVLLAGDDLGPGWNRVQPRGTWREGVSALDRATAFLVNVTGSEQGPVIEASRARLGNTGKPVFLFRLSIQGLENLADGRISPGPEGRYWLVTAVARPQRVAGAVREAFGRSPERHVILPDHAVLNASTIDSIRGEAGRDGVSELVCTSKDAVKIEHGREAFRVLRTETIFQSLDDGPEFRAWLDKWWERI
ncbi:MAG: tetraacyldisaccharide 4'-kinase [Deltaproteobacteria bacterium]|nr:tetraacyldisaccharide 4'-kinase [Deltaproteobacteria bacterium]